MKKIAFMVLAILIFACSSNGEKKVAKSSSTKKSVASVGAVKHISKAEYLALVYNYEKNPKNFVFNGKIPAIVDFYADWCGPCKRVAPILDKLAKKYAGKINFYKVDVDAERDLAAAHGIQSIPTMFFYPMKGDPKVVQGAMGEEQLEDAIQKILLVK
jgi:thioredoxin